jgi:thymidylate synthase
VDIWAEWADEEHTRRFQREAGDLGPVYGYLWRSFGGDYPLRNGVDQIANLIAEIDKNPNSRRLVVTGWDPRQADQVDLPPCHTLFQFKVDGRVLHCQLYQRSADAFLGVPFNISSYALLMHLIAHVCGLDVGEFVYTLGDYHIYQNHLEQVQQLLGREPFPLPKLEILDEGKELRGLDGLLNIRYENLKLAGYQSHGKIVATVAV